MAHVKTYALTTSGDRVLPDVFHVSHPDDGADGFEEVTARLALYDAVLQSLGYGVEFPQVRTEEAETEVRLNIHAQRPDVDFQSLDAPAEPPIDPLSGSAARQIGPRKQGRTMQDLAAALPSPPIVKAPSGPAKNTPARGAGRSR